MKKKTLKTSRDCRRDSMGYTDRFVSALRSMLEWVVRRRVALCGGWLILALLLCCVNLYSSLYVSRATLYLNYPEATQGLYPNDTRFSIYEIKSREVMEQAIAYAGLRGRVTPEELADCLTIRNGNASSVSGASTFICTSYTITYTDHLRLPRHSASSMLSLVCRAYKDYFFGRYTDNQSALLVPDESGNETEYLMALDQLQIRANRLNRYIGDRMKQNKNFQDPVSGLSFSSIQRELLNLLQYDTANLSAYILESGIARNRDNLLSVLNYKIRMNTLVHDRAIAAYQVDNEGISLYDEAMSSIVMIPTTDAAQRYYMSRTRTGMDSLANHADEQLAVATQTQSVIDYDEYVSGKVQQNRSSRAQLQKAEEMIRDMQTRLDRIAREIQQVDNAFVHSMQRDYISFRSNDPSFLASLDLSSVVVNALLLLIAFLFLRLFCEWLRVPGRKKEEQGR